MKKTFFLMLISLIFNILLIKADTIDHVINWKFNKDSSFLTFDNVFFHEKNQLYPVFVENYTFDKPQKINIQFLEVDTLKYNPKDNNFFDTISYKIYTGYVKEKFFVQIVVYPIQQIKGTDQVIILKRFRVFTSCIENSTKQLLNSVNTYPSNSVLKTGFWVKLKIKQDGIYKVTFNQLKSWGFVNMENIQLYGNGKGMLPKPTYVVRKTDLQMIPIYIEKGNDGIFNEGDYILFYGQGPNLWKYNNATKRYFHEKHKFSDFNCYFITDGIGRSLEMTYHNNQKNNSNEYITIEEYDDMSFIENDDINFIKSGSEWYGNIISNNSSRAFNFSFPNMNESKGVYVYYNLLSVANASGTLTISVNNTNFQKKTNNSSTYTYFIIQDTLFTGINSNTLKLTISYSSNSPDANAYVNYIGVNVVRKLVFNGSPMIIKNKNTINAGKIAKYVISNASNQLVVWDITDIFNPSIMPTQLIENNLIFYASTDELRTFIVFSTNGSFLNIIESEKVPNQNIHGAKVPDLIIVSPSDSSILEQAYRLAKFRMNHDKLDVLVVTTNQIYNEFSSGVKDVTAIRDMVKMFYDRDQNKMRYLLLFGKGTYANHIENPNNINLIPTYQSAESLNETTSYVTDDFFGWMNWSNYNDANNFLEIGVGRLPIKNAQEAKAIVDKLIRYENPSNDGDWKNIIAFVADDQDYSVHLDQSEQLANYIENKYPYFRIKKIYLDAYVQSTTSVGDRYPDANNSINNAINNGLLIFNYTGHGNESQLAHEDIIDFNIIRRWKNANKLPLFVTATCSFSRFDNINLQELKTQTSAGEEVLLNANGGAIGLLTTTRLVYSSDNFNLNHAFYKFVFGKDKNGNYYRLGDVLQLTKNAVYYTGINRLNFTLLGDPSLMLAYPKKNVIIVDSIFQNDNYSDTLRALSLATIKGKFVNNQNYNGTVYVTIFDKADTIVTLSNDKDSPKRKFVQRENVVYKGKASVNENKFELQFPIPKDIKYSIDRGKAILYAFDGNTSYSGYYNKFYIGGINNNVVWNNEGPLIRLYMNDTNFIDGGITDPDPVLIAIFEDKDGINATSIGIGHDIIAIIDNDIQNAYLLNDYYQSNTDDFTKGMVRYPLVNLNEGKHTLKVIAYDIFNNYSEACLNFKVVSNNNLIITSVYNYPNPVYSHTSFVIAHNWPNKLVTVEVWIYGAMGNYVRKLSYTGYFEGFVTPPLFWDGLDNNGNKAVSGMYLYKVIMKDKEGNFAEKSGKLIIIN